MPSMPLGEHGGGFYADAYTNLEEHPQTYEAHRGPGGPGGPSRQFDNCNIPTGYDQDEDFELNPNFEHDRHGNVILQEDQYFPWNDY